MLALDDLGAISALVIQNVFAIFDRFFSRRYAGDVVAERCARFYGVLVVATRALVRDFCGFGAGCVDCFIFFIIVAERRCLLPLDPDNAAICTTFAGGKSGGGAGRLDRFGDHFFVTDRRDQCILDIDIVIAGCVAEIILAVAAIPVFNISVCYTGGIFCPNLVKIFVCAVHSTGQKLNGVTVRVIFAVVNVVLTDRQNVHHVEFAVGVDVTGAFVDAHGVSGRVVLATVNVVLAERQNVLHIYNAVAVNVAGNVSHNVNNAVYRCYVYRSAIFVKRVLDYNVDI